MAKYNYILSYDPSMLSPNAGQLQVFIAQNRDIDTWYLAFAGTYIIKSDQPLVVLQEQFQSIFSGSPYLVTWIPQAHTTGAMPPNVWDWFNNRLNPFLPSS